MPRLNLRDDQWDRIAHLLPGKPGDRGRSAADNRLFFEAVLWMARSGAPWRDLPAEFGLWNSVYQRFARWQKRGANCKIERRGDFPSRMGNAGRSVACGSGCLLS